MSGSEQEDRSSAQRMLQTDDASSPVPDGRGTGDHPAPGAAFGFFLIAGTAMALALIVILWLSGLLVFAGSR